MKIQRQVQKKTVSPYLAHGTRVASSIKVSTSAGRNDNSQFSPTTVSRCAASRKKRVPHPYWRRRGSSQGRREIGKGSDCQIEHSYYGMLDHCDSCAEQIARIEWGRTQCTQQTENRIKLFCTRIIVLSESREN